MLLGSPPDMVHVGLIAQDPFVNTQRAELTAQSSSLYRGIDPCYSGFQVQDAANFPAGMVRSRRSMLS